MITDNENNTPPDAAPNENAESNNNQSVGQNTEDAQPTEAQSENSTINPEPEVIVPADGPPAEINVAEETAVNEAGFLPTEGELNTENTTIEPEPEVIVPEDVPPAEINVVEGIEASAEESVLTFADTSESLAPVSEKADTKIEGHSNEQVNQHDRLETDGDGAALEDQESATDEADALENQPAYNEMSRQELAEALKELISRNDLERHKTAFHAMREIYRKWWPPRRV